MIKLFLAAAVLLLNGCTGIPEGITAVNDFELNRYLGKWHEIARLDHRFERGLTDITAEYSLRDDGGINVVNSGFDSQKGERTVAAGKAYFVEQPNIGRLKVSFFEPFYGGYNIIALDKAHYNYVMIAGPSRDYLWILSRTPTLADNILKTLIAQAKSQGFNVDELIYSPH